MQVSGRVTRARSALRLLRDAVRTQLWPLPTLAVVVAVGLGIYLPYADAAVESELPDWLTAVLFGGDAAAASTVLDAVASSLITVTSLTFSLTVVTLQLASSQFSPRLLRTFTQDLFVQATLAIFLGTFAYSLTVLRAVRSGGANQAEFVPRIAVSTSYVLAVISVIALVLFLAHLTRQIRVETMLHEVQHDACGTVHAVLARRDEPTKQGSATSALAPGYRLDPPPHAHPVLAGASGFLLHLDEGELLEAARSADAVVHVTAQPGDFVVAGTPIGSVWGREAALSRPDAKEVAAGVVDSIKTGPERTAAQDVGFGLRQLTDVATKALSPGINDPTTAVHALGHISALLCELAEHELGPVALTDDSGIRAVLARPDLDHLLEMPLTQIRRYGADDPIVLGRLYRLLDELAWHVRVADLSLVERELHRLETTTRDSKLDQTSRDRLSGLAQNVRQTCREAGAIS